MFDIDHFKKETVRAGSFFPSIFTKIHGVNMVNNTIDKFLRNS